MRYQIETIKVSLVKEESETQKVNRGSEAYQVLKAYYETLDSDQEHFTILILDRANHIRGIKTLFTGGEDSTIVDKKVLFRTALLMGAVSLILCHNHPSGEVIPSTDDLSLTIAVKEAGELIGISIRDHIILGNNQFYSFNDKGLL